MPVVALVTYVAFLTVAFGLRVWVQYQRTGDHGLRILYDMKSHIIETPRLLLRPFTVDDVDELHRLWTDPHVRKYLWDDKVIPRETTKSIIESSVSSFETNKFGLWAVLPQAAEMLIGFAAFWYFHEPPKLELLYGMAPAQWNQGLATEVAKALIRHGFEGLSFERIEASTDAANLESARVMEKVGMVFQKRENTNGLDTVYYAISRESYQEAKLIQPWIYES